MDGLLIVDKPAGPTSHDIVARARRAAWRVAHRPYRHARSARQRRPAARASAVRRAWRRFLSVDDKSYDAHIRLGVATDTYDALARKRRSGTPARMPTREAIEAALDAFRGTFLQQPPAFSAKKIGGAQLRARASGPRRLRQPLPARPSRCR